MEAILDFISNNSKGYIHCTVEEAYSILCIATEKSILFNPVELFNHEDLQERLSWQCSQYNERVHIPSVTSYLTVIARHRQNKPIFLILPTVENAVEEGSGTRSGSFFDGKGNLIHTLRLPQALPEGVFVVLGRNDGNLSYIYTESTPQLEYGIQLN